MRQAFLILSILCLLGCEHKIKATLYFGIGIKSGGDRTESIKAAEFYSSYGDTISRDEAYSVANRNCEDYWEKILRPEDGYFSYTHRCEVN